MNSKQPSQILSRRRFLGQASCAAVGSTALFSTLFNLRMASAASISPNNQDGEDYRALVCVFLAGGNDSFNMIVPTEQTAYNEYSSIRSDIALAKNSLLPLNVSGSSGDAFGLHSAMPEVQKLFNDGKACFVNNVGTLVEPTTLNGINTGANKIPLGLFSHADQIMHWQSSVPDKRSATGWAGQVSDLLQSANADQRVSMNISLSGNNVFQTGNNTFSYTISTDDDEVVADDPELLAYRKFMNSSIQSMLDLEYQNLFQKNFSRIAKNSFDANEHFKNSRQSATALKTSFSANEVSKAFQEIARTIASRKALGHKRQTFFLLFGGWDHHDEVLQAQSSMLRILSKGLSEFQSATEELGLSKSVTTFTASDFARTLTSNGRGSDHAWGGNQIVMGGAVNGGRMFGTYPSLYAGNPLDMGRGRLIPTTSVDEYFAELALWFGIKQSDLPLVFPNIDRFYSLNANERPIGFIA